MLIRLCFFLGFILFFNLNCFSQKEILDSGIFTDFVIYSETDTSVVTVNQVVFEEMLRKAHDLNDSVMFSHVLVKTNNKGINTFFVRSTPYLSGCASIAVLLKKKILQDGAYRYVIHH